MFLLHKFSDWYYDAKDYIAEFYWNGPRMIRIPFYKKFGEGWINYYGWVPKNLWDGGIRQVGLLDLMTKVGMNLGWQRNARCFPHSVRLLDTVFDNNGQLAISPTNKRKSTSAKKQRK